MSDVSPEFAAAGSQRWLQVAVNRAPNLLLDVLRPALHLDPEETIEWRSPLENDGYKEYRDQAALRQLGIDRLPNLELSNFWPQRGPVWDALGKTSKGQYLFLEAKAHIAEIASPASRASDASLPLIEQSLEAACMRYAPKYGAKWGTVFYQYTNRLAHQYLFHHENRLPTHMVFLYFINAKEMNGPESEAEWRGALKMLHYALGLRESLENEGVHEVFMDVDSVRHLIP